MIRRVLGSAARLGARGTQRLTYRMRLALEPEYLAMPIFAAGHKGYSFLEELSSALKTYSKKEQPYVASDNRTRSQRGPVHARSRDESRPNYSTKKSQRRAPLQIVGRSRRMKTLKQADPHGPGDE